MSEEKPFVYAVCQYVRSKTVTSYKIGKIYKSKGFHSDILTNQCLCGYSDISILTTTLTKYEEVRMNDG